MNYRLLYSHNYFMSSVRGDVRVITILGMKLLPNKRLKNTFCENQKGRPFFKVFFFNCGSGSGKGLRCLGVGRTLCLSCEGIPGTVGCPGYLYQRC